MVDVRVYMADGTVIDLKNIPGALQYSSFKQDLASRCNGSIHSLEILEEDRPKSPSEPLDATAFLADLRCSTWSSGADYAPPVTEKDYKPLQWFHNVIGNRLRTLATYFTSGNLVLFLRPLLVMHSSAVLRIGTLYLISILSECLLPSRGEK